MSYIIDTLKSSEMSHEIISTSPESTFPPISKISNIPGVTTALLSINTNYIIDTENPPSMSDEIISTSPWSTLPPMSKASNRVTIVTKPPDYFLHYITIAALDQFTVEFREH
jgi:hypothetical protein